MKNMQREILFFISVALLFVSSSCADSSEPSNSNSQSNKPPVTSNQNVTPLSTPTPLPSVTPSPLQSPSPVKATPTPSVNPTVTPQSNTNSLNLKTGKSTAVVTKIDMDEGSIELDHKDIPGMMPAMIMEFHVKDKKMLNGLKVGDKVSFTLENRDGQEQIIELKKQ